ncbi:MAG: DUF2516 family protein [Promicromonosporaceae bacterium]|nr:DUF2516 family protein [Promicromonosporaceae bacterium]
MGVIDWIRWVISILITAAVTLACLTAFIDAARRPPAAFDYAEKRPKTTWLLITGIGLAVATLGALSLSGLLRSAGSLLFTIIALAPAGVYWYDVRPEVANYRPRSPSRW